MNIRVCDPGLDSLQWAGLEKGEKELSAQEDMLMQVISSNTATHTVKKGKGKEGCLFPVSK